MLRHLRGWTRAGPVLLTLLLMGWNADAAEAAKVSFKNDGPSPIIVQGTVVVNGLPQRSKPLLLAPMQSDEWPQVPKGNILITIYDATRPNRVLYQGTTLIGTTDQSFSVQPEPGTPRAKLVPVQQPK